MLTEPVVIESHRRIIISGEHYCEFIVEITAVHSIHLAVERGSRVRRGSKPDMLIYI